MAAKGYTNKTAVENYTLKDISATFNTQVDEWIEGVEDYIDKQTGRNFIADSSATERVYDGDDSFEILIDDAVEVTKVEIGEDNPVEVTEGNYYLYPANTTPKHRIRLKNRYFDIGRQNVTITAKWGYSTACPADIKFAATVLVAGITNYASPSKGKVKSESIGNYSVSYDTDKGWQDLARVQSILGTYRKITF